MKVEILCTGDEIVSGKTVNSNHSFMAQRLQDAGFVVHRGTVVGDDRESLAEAFRLASKRADVVIVNGGLGPTVDDLSQEVAASAAGVELELHTGWLARMQGWYASHGRVMPENNTKQAMLPQGAEFIDNPVGTACGFALDIAGARFFFTPGVPFEMRRMITEQIIPRLEVLRGFKQVTVIKRLHTFGIGESNADRLLEGVEALAGGAAKLGFQSHFPELEIKLVGHGADRGELEAAMAPAVAALRERLDGYVVAEDDESLAGRIIALLAEAGKSLVTLEGETRGSVLERLMAEDVQDCSVVLRGAVALRADQLAAEAGVVLESDEFSGAVVMQLAEGMREQANAGVGLCVLVTMGNDDVSSEVMIGVSDGVREVFRAARLPGRGKWIRLGATEMALDVLRRFLMGKDVYQRIDFEEG